MEDHIFSPLKMENTSANVSDFAFEDIRPSLTVTKEMGIIEKGFYKSDITMHASGGIISTIDDLSKWLAANINQDNVLLNKDSWGNCIPQPQPRTKNTLRTNDLVIVWAGILRNMGMIGF